jgi:hypothetical protein
MQQRYSHLNGYEYMIVNKPDLWLEIAHAIQSVDAGAAYGKVSKEKTMPGRVLYSPAKLNQLFAAEFQAMGWQEARVSYYVNEDLRTTRETVGIKDKQAQKDVIAARGFTPFATYNQVDFVKNGVAVEVQFGKYFSVQYDLHVKHTFFFERGDIDAGVEIIPMHSLMSRMSSGVPWYENELANIVREGRSNPSVPIILIGIEP